MGGNVSSKQIPINDNQNHFVWIDQVRGSAAIYVVCHHALLSVVIKDGHAHDLFFRVLQMLTGYGHWAVDIFIVLSGYCLTLPLKVRGFGNVGVFYLRRTIRIVLPYYASILFTLILTYLWLETTQGFWADNALPVSSDSIFKHLLLIHQWDQSVATKINGAFWSIGVEYQIYLLFPLFWFLGNYFGFFYTSIYISITSYVLWALCFYFDVFNPGVNGVSIYYCSLFFMGVTAAKYATDRSLSDQVRYFDKYPKHVFGMCLIGIFGLIVIKSLAWFVFEISIPLQIQSFFIGLLASIMFYLNSRNKLDLLKPLGNKFSRFLSWAGMIGFSLYLIHDPILAMVWSYIIVPLELPAYWMKGVLQLIIGLSISLVVARFFYYFIELPCHKLSKSISEQFR
jgi:peptidoglycan/LPS O-acetylase OafA/YrhL